MLEVCADGHSRTRARNVQSNRHPGSGQRMAARAAVDREQEFRAAARAAHLRYVSDASRGYSRRRRGKKSFTYLRPSGEPLRDRATIERIRSLAIPPAWKDVWICP